MLAKVFVKTPIICYIRRDAPDSGTRELISSNLFELMVEDAIYACKDFDKLFSKVEFFRDNEFMQYIAKARYISLIDSAQIISKKTHQNGITLDLFELTSKIFKKHFGDNYFYPMFMFNWAHVLPFGQRVDNINFNDKSFLSKESSKFASQISS